MIIQDNLGLTDEGYLVIPRGKKGLQPLSINLKLILASESKIEEIRRATGTTLPDLITSFILALNHLAKAIAVVELECREAKRYLDESKSVALLEKVEEVLRTKNIKSSADTREAVIILDPEVRDAQGRVDTLTAIQTFLYNKHGVIDRSYHGAKKICDMYLKTPYSTTFGGEDGQT